MHFLYLDDSGSPGNPSDKHFVLAGIAVFERQVHWLQQELERVAEEVAEELGHPSPSTLEFHANHILQGKSSWRGMAKEKRRDVILKGLGSARELRGGWRLFGVVVDKRAISPENPVDYAFEQLCSRFDLFLKRQYNEGNAQRGLIILDKTGLERRLQSMASEFKRVGHRWGAMRNLPEVPLFVDSMATRLMQYADLVAYALWRKFEQGDGRFFDGIADCFDSEGGIVHGLHHFKRPSEACDCPGCL